MSTAAATGVTQAQAASIVGWFRSRPPRAGAVRVLAIDGRSGSGKSTLGRAVAAELAAPMIRMDDLYPGWDGLLGGVGKLVEWVLRPLADGRTARWRRYDWEHRSYAEWHDVPAAGSLVVEGVGAGAREGAQFLSGLVWLGADEGVRRRRALIRDGAAYAPHWDRWARQEERFYATDDVRRRADLAIRTDGHR